jgi:hypothetical protein
MENGEDFFIEFFNGSSYEVIGQYISGQDFSNGSFFTDTIVLDAGTYNFTTNNRIRIRCDASNNNDQVWFDQIVLTGDNVNAPVNNNTATLKKFNATTDNNIKLYPNPTNSVLNIEILDGQFDEIVVFSSTGKVIQSIDPNTDDLSVDVSQLASGMYFVRFVSNGLATTKRFIKN